MTSDINNPIVSHCLLFTMALKGMEPAPNPQRRGGSKKLEGGSFKFVTPALTGKLTLDYLDAMTENIDNNMLHV